MAQSYGASSSVQPEQAARSVERASSVRPVGEQDRAAAPLGGGLETGALVRSRHRIELVGSHRRRRRVTGGDGNLDLGDQQWRPCQLVGDTGQGGADQRRRGVGAALRQADEGEPRLRVAAQLVTQAVGVLGAVEIAPQPPDLTDLVAGFGDDADMDVGDVLADPLRLVLGLRPGAADLHDLGRGGRGRCP